MQSPLLILLVLHVNASDERFFFKNPDLLGLTSSFCSLPDFLELLLATKTIYEHRQLLLKTYLGEDAEKCFGDAEIPAPKFFRLCQSVLSDENIAFSELKVQRRGDDFEVKIWNPTVSMFFAFNAILSREVNLSTNGIKKTAGAILVSPDFPFFLQTNEKTYTLSTFSDFFGKFRFLFKPPASFSWIERRFDFGDKLANGVRLGKMSESSDFPLQITQEIPLKMALFILSKAGDWRHTEKRAPTYQMCFGNLNSATKEYKPCFAENLRNCNQQPQISADNKRKQSSISSTKSAKGNESAKKI